VCLPQFWFHISPGYQCDESLLIAAKQTDEFAFDNSGAI
jgi:hypothetical protein